MIILFLIALVAIISISLNWKDKKFADYFEEHFITKFSNEPSNIHDLRNKGIADIISIVMKEDGIASKSELQVVAAYLKRHFYSDDYADILEALKIRLKINNRNKLMQACKWATELMNQQELLAFMEFLFDIASITHGINANEWRLLTTIMCLINLNEQDQKYLATKYAHLYNSSDQGHYYSDNRESSDNSSKKSSKKSTRRSRKRGKSNNSKGSSNKSSDNSSRNSSTVFTSNPSRDAALRVLGLGTNATLDEIKQAYRRLAKKISSRHSARRGFEKCAD